METFGILGDAFSFPYRKPFLHSFQNNYRSSLLEANKPHGKKATPSNEDLHSMRPPLYLAQEVGKGMGRSEVLQ